MPGTALAASFVCRQWIPGILGIVTWDGDQRLLVTAVCLPVVEVLRVSISVQKLCRQTGLTAAELAARSGLDEKRVEAIVLGRWTASPDERARIAAVFNTPVESIAWRHTTPVEHFHGPG